MVKIKGKTPVAKSAIKKAVQPKVESKTVRADETPETKPTLPAKRSAAEKQFAKADKAAEPKQEELDEVRIGRAVRGY